VKARASRSCRARLRAWVWRLEATPNLQVCLRKGIAMPRTSEDARAYNYNKASSIDLSSPANLI